MDYGLIGNPLGHSYSKDIHEKLGKYEYTLNQVEPDEMKAFVEGRNFKGFNVTIPYKRDVIPMCDHITDLAQEIGAVNTLFFKDGELWGHNTDYEGFLYSSKRGGIVYTDKVVLVLGTGGASLSALAAIKHEGCKAVYRATRSEVEFEDGADADAADSDKIGSDKVAPYDALINYRDIPKIAQSVQVVVNTTPVGTYPNNLEKVIDLDQFPKLEAVMDVIYNPSKIMRVFAGL